MADNKKPLIGLVLLAVFFLLVTYIPKFVEGGVPIICVEDGDCQHEAYLDSLISYIPLFIIFGFLLGIGISYLYFERKIEAPAKDRSAVVLSFLPPGERRIIAKLIEKKGEVLQSEISRIEGIGKVKAHRIVDKLIRRGILEKEQVGKTNIIRLKKEVREGL